MAKKELVDTREAYSNIYAAIEVLENMYFKRPMSLSVMNSWLLEIVKFYTRKGEKISENDFLALRGINDFYDQNETVIRKYMKLFFEKKDRPEELDSDEFLQIVFDMDNYSFGGKDDEANDEVENPIFSYIAFAVDRLHRNHFNLFSGYFDTLQGELDKLGILKNCKFTPDNMGFVKQIVRDKIAWYDREIEAASRMEQLSTSRDNMFNRLCNLITDGRYSTMSDSEQENVEFMLRDVCTMVIKLRLFYELKKEYEGYSKEAGYKKLIDEINANKIKSEINEDKSLKWANVPLVGKKAASIYHFKSESLNDTNVELVADYLNGFYKLFKMPQWLNDCGISDVFDTHRLFGAFDIDKLPPSVDKINLRDEYANYGIVLPCEDSNEFSELCLLAYKYLIGNSNRKEYARIR